MFEPIFKINREDKQVYHKRLFECGIWQVLMVKLCDRLHNLHTLSSCSGEKQTRQIQETRKYFFALAATLIKLLPQKAKWRGEYLKKQIQGICDQYPA